MRSFQWNEAATNAVIAIKEVMQNLPTLSRYKHELETHVTTDASAVGIGTILEQLHGHE